MTPRGTLNRLHVDLPTGPRGRSPSAERASSLGVNNGPKKDTRPLNDKAYQTAMLQRIDNFFKDCNQSSMLNSSGSLRPVSLKNFVAASDFLLKLLEIKQNLTLVNYMEELPKIAKKLHYPGTITKSWLKTASAMHAWPYVLAWLSWLVEICEATDIAREQFQLESLPFSDANDGEAINRNQFLHMLKIYSVWNEGKEEAESALMNEYVQSIADQCGLNEEDIRKGEEEIEESIKKFNDIMIHEAEIDELSAILNAKLQAVKDDENKQIAHEQAQIDYLNATGHELEQLDKEINYLDKERAKHLRQHEELNANIKQQVMTVEERDSILRQCSEIQSYITQFDDHLEEIKNELWVLEVKYSQITDKLSKAILAYNRDIMINITQDTNEVKMPESGLGTNPNVVGLLNAKVEAMTHLKDTIKKEINISKSSIDKNTNKLETLQDKKKMIEQEKMDWLSKNNENKLCIKNLKLRAKKEETTLRDAIKKLEDDIKIIKTSFPDVELTMHELQEAKEKLDALFRRKQFLEQSAERFSGKIFEILGHDRVELEKTMRGLMKQ